VIEVRELNLLNVVCAGPGGMGVDSAAMADLEAELGEIKRHAVIIDDVKMQLMAVSDRLNALTEFLVSDTSASKSTRQFQVCAIMLSAPRMALRDDTARVPEVRATGRQGHAGIHNCLGQSGWVRELGLWGAVHLSTTRVLDDCDARDP